MKQACKIKVGVADDHPVVLVGVTAILDQCMDIEISFSTEEVDILLSKLTEEPVDVLLCDYQFPNAPLHDGLILLKNVKRVAPETQVIFFSASSQPHIVSGVLGAGASGFIDKKESDFINLPQAIRNVHAGQIHLSQSLSSFLLRDFFSPKKKKKKGIGLEALSAKELDVASMICQGLSIGEVAKNLHSNPKTVYAQKKSAMKKLGAANDIALEKIVRDLLRWQAMRKTD